MLTNAFFKGRRGLAVAVFGVLILAAPLSAQLGLKLPGKKKPAAGPAPFAWTVRPEWLRAHEEFLASDALAGRGSATRDEEIAATYVASEFQGYGLIPAPGTTGYIQRIDVDAPLLDGKATLAGGGVVLTEGQDMDLLYASGISAAGPVQRIPASEARQAKVTKGAVVIVTAMAKDADVSTVFRALRRAGAAVVLVERSESTAGFLQAIGGHTSVPVHLKEEASGQPSAGTTLVAMSEAAARGLDRVRDGQTLTLTVHAETKPRQTFNAIGFLAGSDPASGTILLTAHLDHLGVGKPVNGDAIYNGANDDAAGTTAVLELAHALSSGPKLRRSVLFVCYGSEEAGELGSEYFGRHSPVPLKDIVANLEFEMIGNQDPKMPKGTLLLTGWDRSNLGATLKEHGAMLGPDPYPEQRFFERSDNYQLALEGVVAHTAAGWGTVPTYHQPNDDLAHLDFEFMTAAIQSLVQPMEWFATSDFKPAWFPGAQPKR